MSASPYTEDNLVQLTTADYLERRLGWQSVYAYNTETFGPDGTLGRTNDGEVVLTRYLRRALENYNPGLPGGAYENAIREIVQVSTAQSTLQTNLEKYGPEVRARADVRSVEHVATEVTPEVRLLQVISGEMTRHGLRSALGLKNDEHFRKAYLVPALQAGLIEMTVPDKPRSRNQRYRLTPEGHEFLRQTQESQ